MALNFWKVKKGLNFDIANSGSVVSSEGDLAYNSTSHKFEWKDNSATRSAVSEDGTQTLSNKTLDNTSTITVKDANFTVQDDGDTTKQFKIQASGISTSTTRTMTVPDADFTVVGIATTQTLTNKTINGSNNTITNVSLTTGVTGALPIANGGTGQTAKAAAFDALSPNTTKGDLVSYSTTNARLGVGSDGQVLTADSSQTLGVKWATASASPTSGSELLNLSVSGSITSNILTVALKQSDGSSDPAAGAGAVKIGFRNGTLATGGYNERSVTASTTLTIGTTASLGTITTVPQYIYIYAMDNAGTVELAASLHSLWDEGVLQTSSTTNNSNQPLFAANARSTVPVRLLGRIKATWTSGTGWSSITELTTVPFENKESMTMSYNSGTTTISNSAFTNVAYSTKEFDTHNSYNTSTGIFTVPFAGTYDIAASFATTDNVISTSNLVAIAIYKNSTEVKEIAVLGNGGNNAFSPMITLSTSCAANDTLEVRGLNSAGSQTLRGGATRSWFKITRTGN